VLGITDPPVTIKNIENAIIDRGFAEGWVKPNPPETRTGKKVAVVGSGPAGWPPPRSSTRSATKVTVYERADRIGGLADVRHPQHEARQGRRRAAVNCCARKASLRHRRARRPPRGFPAGHMTRIMQQRGERIRYVDPHSLRDEYDALLLATGATVPRDLPIPGRQLAKASTSRWIS
jgi:glutamate synthase (NADPH) small chain